nr:MAG TPA: intron associated endonuclease [Siphoviridae sp. ctEup56]
MLTVKTKMLIYKITNTINNKIYIGQTTQTLSERIHNYKSEVKFYKGNPRPIILAMRKYGFENFCFEIVEDNIQTKEELDEREIYYIKFFDCQIENRKGYNLENGGNSVGKHPESVKKKIGLAQIGPKNHMYGKCGELNKTSKTVIDITTGKVYGSAMIAAKENGLNFSHICACARGTRGSTGGKIFRYLDNNKNIILPEERKTTRFQKIKDNVLDQYKQYI